jgi:hypothetical protein
VFCHPLQGGVRVVDCGGIPMLGSQAIVDGNDDCIDTVGERTTDPVVGGQRTHDPAAAMEIDDDRPRRSTRRTVDTYGDLDHRPGDRRVDHLSHRDGGRDGRRVHQSAYGDRVGSLAEAPEPGCHDQVDDHLGLRIE